MNRETELIELLEQVPSEQSGVMTAVTAGELFRSDGWRNTSGALPLMIGKGMDGGIVTLDLAKAPHLLMAGMTGSGKSVLMDLCLFSLMFRHTPEELKLILVDTKIVEFEKYESLPYLQVPMITNTMDTLKALHWLNTEMARRYDLLAEASCRDILVLNAQKPDAMPYIVLFINEVSDAMLDAATLMENNLAALCARGRPVGIHLVISTQRPDRRVLTAGIRANFPTRIAFQAYSAADSRTILGCEGAENLQGRGDMLCRFSAGLQRVKGGYINENECDRLLERLMSIYKDFRGNIVPPISKLEAMDDDIVMNAHLQDRLTDIVRDVLEENLDYLTREIVDAILVNSKRLSH